MKRLLTLLTLLCLLLCGCAAPLSEEPEEPDEPEAPPAQEEPERPLHSPFYLEGVSVDDVILYFSEVCLDAEVSDSGDPTVIQRWEDPIFYKLHGDYTDADAALIEDFARWLNTMETPNNFLGLWESREDTEPNLNIYFCTPDEMATRIGDWTRDCDGAFTYWYTDNVVYDAIICCRSDAEGELRTSVILEEIYNSLGPVQDTSLRSDSIAYAEFSTPQQLSAIDELILELLYHPDMNCGMNAEECAELIRELYY